MISKHVGPILPSTALVVAGGELATGQGWILGWELSCRLPWISGTSRNQTGALLIICLPIRSRANTI